MLQPMRLIFPVAMPCGGGASELYRVSVSAEDERTLRREFRALWEVMSENGIGGGRAHRWVGSRWNTSRAEGQSGRLPLDVGAHGVFGHTHS